MYSEQFTQKLPGSNQDFYFRTQTKYGVDANGKPVDTGITILWYAPKPAARTSDGKTWTPGNEDGKGFNPGGWVAAAESEDGGKTWGYFSYNRRDQDQGKIPPGKKVGEEVLGATAQQSLSTSGGRFYEAVQNNLINTAVKTKPGLAQVVSAKQKNAPVGTNLDSFNYEDKIEIDPTKTRTKFPTDLKYPIDISKQQDKLKIDMIEFKTRKFNLQTLTFNDRDQTIQTTKGTVILAIPGNVSDNNRVNWGSQDVNAGDAAVAMSALNIIKNGGPAIEALTKSLESLATDPNVSRDVRTGFAAFFAGNAAGVQGLLARTAGAVINPNTELLFQGPALRAFTFSFKLSPRSEAEAKMVRSIIRFFKQGMAVQRTQSELFLKAPMIYKLSFRSGTTEHTFLPKTKLCALLDCSINYTPEGTYATFKDSSMVSYDMSLTFNELDPIFNDDYKNSENGPDTNIGY